MPITEGGRFTPNDRIVSPGVFTRENDLSGITQGVADIGAAIVAPFPKGPGFAPTLVTNTNDLESKFGVADGVYYGPYTAKEYLNEKGFVMVCRVGGLTGYNQEKPLAIYAKHGSWTREYDMGAAEGIISDFGMFSYITSSATSGASLPIGSGVVTYDQSQSFPQTGSNQPNYPTGSGFSTYASPIYYIGNNPGQLNISGIIPFKFAMEAATDTELAVTSSSGSLFYNNTTVNISNNIELYTVETFTVYSSSITNRTTDSGNGTTSSLYSVYTGSCVYIKPGYGTVNVENNDLSASIANNTFSGSFLLNLSSSNGISSDQEYFDSKLHLISGSFSTPRQTVCNADTVKFVGVLSGTFGRYTGMFESDAGPGSGECGVYSANTASVKLLAVLANTQYENLDDNLAVPGFSGSKLYGISFTPDLSGSYGWITGSGLLIDGNSGSINHNYKLLLTSSKGDKYGSYEFSIDPASTKYITNVFGDDPTARGSDSGKKEVAYVYAIFEDSMHEVSGDANSWAIVAEAIPSKTTEGSFSGSNALEFIDINSLTPSKGDSAYALRQAETPWVVSQAVSEVDGNSYRFELFKLHTLSDGTDTNTAYKIEISNIRLAGTVAGSNYGSFNLAVRNFNDTENRTQYLEFFQNLNLDPNSPNYIARRIGDRYNYINYGGKIFENGTYANLSKCIRVEMSDTNYPISAVPYGFNAYSTPFGGNIAHVVPPMRYTKASIYSNAVGKYASGVVFGQTLSADDELTKLYPTSSAGKLVYEDNLQYFKPLPKDALVGSNLLFALDLDYTSSGVCTSELLSELRYNDGFPTGSNYNAIPAVNTSNEPIYSKMRKFVFGFQQGFDGQSPTIPINVGTDITDVNTQGLDCSKSTKAGSIAYKQCIGALGNADEFDINLIATPGILNQQHSYVTNMVIDMCENRGDCFYIMDNIGFPNQNVSLIDDAINDVSTIDSNYVATYYPWIKILDTNMNKIISVPPSVVMPAIYASSDNAAAEWFAPAGLNRGGIAQAVQVLDRLTFQERDTLYEGRINPIAAFPGQGICVWGQKTLQVKASSLDRISVRRLLIALKKFIASTSKYLVFEQNVSDTRNRFLSVVNPYLESVQQRAGLYAFKVVMDATNNTADIIDNNQMYGQIYLQPSKTAEYVILDFNILPTGGATFPGA